MEQVSVFAILYESALTIRCFDTLLIENLFCIKDCV